MDEITLKDYRCFHKEQTARLAPLTLLVGENSTGKTSFLAMIRALWDAAYRVGVPNFKEEPYDLGSFEEIAHHRGSRGRLTNSFESGFNDSIRRPRLYRDFEQSDGPYQFEITFEKEGFGPIPARKRQSIGTNWIEEYFEGGRLQELTYGTRRGSWIIDMPFELNRRFDLDYNVLSPLRYGVLKFTLPEFEGPTGTHSTPLSGSPAFSSEDLAALAEFDLLSIFYGRPRPFASAPVRSKPRRTYDPALVNPDSEGDHVPTYLANLSVEDKTIWKYLKTKLEDFGKAAGLFDEITIKQLGTKGIEPFQVQVRKFEGKRKGPLRNLTDVGYGVSQVLPVITELLRRGGVSMSLLQQPEVHLHPSAQAALGSLFCEVASSGQQLVVETHSDHLLDRVRMEVRDGTTDLKPEDVSILFFERDGLEVNIHSLGIDDDGNIEGQPDNYRKFFMDEIRRSLGL